MKHHQPFIGSLDTYRELFEEMEDILLIIDQQGTVEYVNRSLRKHLGYSTKRFTGKNIDECCLFDGRVTRQQMIDRIFQEKDFSTRIKYKGRFLSFSWRTKTFHHGQKKLAIAVIRNMTSHLELQQKVQDYTSNLEEMVYQRTQQLEKEKQKAIELHQAKAAFLSKMSHELRTPLTAIRGFAELLQEEQDLSPEQKDKYVSVIEKNAVHLLNMITETLQLIQMEQNKYQIHEKSFSLSSLLNELIETYRVLADKKGLKLECQIAEEIPKKLFSDPNAIRQILTNLIGNAIKFTEEGTIVLSIKSRTLSHKFSGKLYFYIQDSGVGIPKHQHQRIFKSFEQYLGHQSMQTRGTGLGLPISRQLAKLLGGDVKLVSSVPYKGSVFVFSLPIRRSKHSQKKE
ncbi:MAG: ATP-binding protein [Candidatus Altimarinota bacterium]